MADVSGISDASDLEATYEAVNMVPNVTVALCLESTATEDFRRNVWPSRIMKDVILLSSEVSNRYLDSVHQAYVPK